MNDFDHAQCERLAQTGRRLASQREDLIVAGVDPALLEIPISYWCRCLGESDNIEVPEGDSHD